MHKIIIQDLHGSEKISLHPRTKMRIFFTIQSGYYIVQGGSKLNTITMTKQHTYLLKYILNTKI